MDNAPAGKKLAILGYASGLFFFVFLPASIAVFGLALILNNGKNQPFAAFHLRQMFGIIAAYAIVSIFADLVPTATIAFSMVCFFALLAILGLVSALKNQTDELPIVGALFQKWFSFIK